MRCHSAAVGTEAETLLLPVVVWDAIGCAHAPPNRAAIRTAANRYLEIVIGKILLVTGDGYTTPTAGHSCLVCTLIVKITYTPQVVNRLLGG